MDDEEQAFSHSLQREVYDEKLLVVYGMMHGVCSTDLRLDSFTEGLKRVYTSWNPILEITYFSKNMCLSIMHHFFIFNISLENKYKVFISMCYQKKALYKNAWVFSLEDGLNKMILLLRTLQL